MSLLSRERLVIGLSPAGLSALRVDGALREEVLERHEQPLNSGGGWEPLLAALEVLLEQPAWAAHELGVVLSNHFVHYVVAPGRRGLSVAERNGLARLLFRNTFGEMSSDWDMRLSPAGDQPTLASAVPQPLLKGLRDICDVRGRLRSIQPALMAVFNRVRTPLGKGSGTLALVEPGRISLAAIVDGEWQSVVSRAGQGGMLGQFLLDEHELHGRPAGGTLWLCELGEAAQLPAASPWQVERLAPPRAAAAPYCLADWGAP